VPQTRAAIVGWGLHPPARPLLADRHGKTAGRSRRGTPSQSSAILMPSTKLRTKLYFFSCHGAASNYTTLKGATEAAEVYSLDRGYPCEPFFCDACKRYHMRQSEAPREIPEDDRWSPARHRALRVRLKAGNEALLAEQERVRALENAVKEKEKAEKALKMPKEAVRCVRVVMPRPRPRGLSPKEQRDQWHADGRCTRCGRAPVPGRNNCVACRAACKKHADRYLQKKGITLAVRCTA
jgi:hypothetical protein